jgi:hypothetical protein
MTPKVKSIPEGYHSVTPSLVVREGAKALEFYRRAFGAEERVGHRVVALHFVPYAYRAALLFEAFASRSRTGG